MISIVGGSFSNLQTTCSRKISTSFKMTYLSGLLEAYLQACIVTLRVIVVLVSVVTFGISLLYSLLGSVTCRIDSHLIMIIPHDCSHMCPLLSSLGQHFVGISAVCINFIKLHLSILELQVTGGY